MHVYRFSIHKNRGAAPLGAKVGAVIYSPVETANANGLSERGYPHIVPPNLLSMDFRQHPELLKDLLPWSDCMRSCFEQE